MARGTKQKAREAEEPCRALRLRRRDRLNRAGITAAGQQALTATGLTKRYGAQAVVDGVTLHLEFGDRIGIGPNGAMKSTLLDILGRQDGADRRSALGRDGGASATTRRAKT